MIETLDLEFVCRDRAEALAMVDTAAKRWFGEHPFRVQSTFVRPELIVVTGDGQEQFDQWRVEARVMPDVATPSGVDPE